MDTAALPPLPLAEWKPTCDTLHMWTQIIGKVRLKLAPLLNHWWEVPLYVSARGLTTSAIPYGDLMFDCEFDFVDHHLLIRASNRRTARVALQPRSVADFYQETMARLRECGIDVAIWTVPSEVDNPVPFPEDHEHASYDRDAVERFLAGADVLRTRTEPLPVEVHRQEQPSPFLLGKLRPGGDAILRQAGTSEPGCRCDHPRGVLA
jgi:hypothetical protein